MVVKDRFAEQDPTAHVAVEEAMAYQSTGSGKGAQYPCHRTGYIKMKCKMKVKQDKVIAR